MNTLKLPSVLTTLIANAAMVIGGAIGWFTVSTSLHALDAASGSTLETNLNGKKTATIVVAIISIVLTLIVAKWQKRWLQILPLLLNAFIAFATFNQLSGKQEAEAFGVHYAIGYWLSLVAAVVATVGCLWVIATVRKNK